MRNKILHDLAASPSSLHEFIRYKNNIKRDIRLRRMGVFFLCIGFAVYLFAFLLPPEKSTLFSSNNLYNGIATKGDLLQAWDNNANNLADIYSHFGVTKDDLFNLSDKPDDILKSTASTNYWVATKNRLGPPVTNENGSNQIIYKIKNESISFQPLKSWHDKPQNFKAFKGRAASSGKTFWIIAESGNFVQNGRNINNAPPTSPVIKAKKTIFLPPSVSTQLNKGDNITYRIDLQNTQSGTLAENVTVSDKIPSEHFDINNNDNLLVKEGDNIKLRFGNIPYSDYATGIELTLTAKSPIDTSTLCEPANLTAYNGAVVRIQTSGSGCPAHLEKEQSPLSLSQKAFNHTFEKLDATTTTNYANDTLEYELSFTNTSGSVFQDRLPEFYIGDILDYAVLDETQTLKNNWVYNKSLQTIEWPNTSIPEYTSINRTIYFTIKKPTPLTNSPNATTTDYDCILSSTYPLQLNVSVHCPALKSYESLPGISGIAALTLVMFLTIISGAFLISSRYLHKLTVKAHEFYKFPGEHHGR